MGYSYGAKGLVCDLCGACDGTAKKVRCPFGWCPPTATCKACRNNPEVKRKQDHVWHVKCPALAAELRSGLEKEAALIAAGKFVRCSAMNIGAVTRVIFRGAGKTVGYSMAPETYEAIPMGEPATPEDYATIGAIEPAPHDFDDYYRRAVA